MTALCSHQDTIHEPAGVGRVAMASWLGALLRWAVSRTSDAFGSRADRSLGPVAHENRDPDSDAARFPQRPLILGDKWDF
jgi:hypothetical protein